MGTIADEIQNQVKAGQQTIERSLNDLQKQIDSEQMSRAGIAVAGVMVFALALGVGWIVYQRRRRHTLVERLQNAIPEVVRDLPEEVRAQVKPRLQRAIRAL